MSRHGWWLSLLLLSACAGRCGAARADREAPRDDDDPLPLEPAEERDAEALGPTRCAPKVPVGPPLQLVGNAVAHGTGVLVSVVTASPPALALLDLPEGRVTSLRSQPGDAPAAALAVDGERIAAALFEPPTKTEQVVQVLQVEADGPRPLFRITRPKEESLAVDLAWLGDAPHVLWHENGELVVRSEHARIVLPTPAHAVLESPRLIAHGGRLLAFAIARVWEGVDAGVRAGPLTTWEGAGEPRSTSWLVGYVVGAEASAPVALGSPRGHVDAYDAHLVGKDVVLFAHDAAQTDARGGGSLTRIRWSGAGDPSRVGFRAGDVGGGPFAVSGFVLSYGNATGEAILVSLAQDLWDLGHASREPSLDDTRIVGSASGRGLLVAGPSDLAWVACEGVNP